MIFNDFARVEPLLREGCTHELDASRPLDEVVADLIAIASRPMTTSAGGILGTDLAGLGTSLRAHRHRPVRTDAILLEIRTRMNSHLVPLLTRYPYPLRYHPSHG